LAKNNSLNFKIAENSFFDSLNVVGSELLKGFAKLSAREVLLKNFMDTVTSSLPFSFVDLFVKPEF